MLAAVHISEHAASRRMGNPMPPNALGAVMPFQPPSHHVRYAAAQPGGVVTAPSRQEAPCRSPTVLSGASTAPAILAASSSIASAAPSARSGYSGESSAVWCRSANMMSAKGAR